MVSDKTIHKAFRILFIKLYEQNPLQFFFLHYLPKLYFGFNIKIDISFSTCINTGAVVAALFSYGYCYYQNDHLICTLQR